MSNGTTRVYCGNLPFRVTERDLYRFFRRHGRVRDIVIKKRYGFVEFDDWRDAEDAVCDLNGRDLMGNRIVVERTVCPPKGRDAIRQTNMFGYGGSTAIGGWSYPFAPVGPPRPLIPARSFSRRRPVSPSRRRPRSTSRSGSRDRTKDRRNDRFGPPTMTRWRIIVKNVSSRATWQDLKDFFRQAGEVTYADCHKERKNEGIVCFLAEADLRQALEKLDGKPLSGRNVKLIDDSSKVARSTSRSKSVSPSRSKSNSRAKSSSRSRSRSPLKRSPASGSEHAKSASPTTQSDSVRSKSRSRSNSRSSPRLNDISDK